LQERAMLVGGSRTYGGGGRILSSGCGETRGGRDDDLLQRTAERGGRPSGRIKSAVKVREKVFHF